MRIWSDIRAFVPNHFCGHGFEEITQDGTLVFSYPVEVWDL